MRKKIIIALVSLLVLILVFVGIVALQPTDFRITRSATFNAPRAVVFSQVDDFHNWQAWSPWAKLDPAAKNTFEGPASGKGASFKWSGNDEIGEGKMTVLESRPSELISIKLEFIRPFEDTSTTDFTFVGADDETVVTWSMTGKHNFISKAMCLFMNMDKMVGDDFEKGLGQMKVISEKQAKSEASKAQDGAKSKDAKHNTAEPEAKKPD